jgi:anti-anti-sigma factor
VDLLELTRRDTVFRSTEPTADERMPPRIQTPKLTVASVGPAEPSLLRLRLGGPITILEVSEADRQLEEALGVAGYRQRVLIDLENTSYIDSAGISWLLVCHKHFVQWGGRAVFHSAPPLVRQTLTLLRLESVLHLAADEDAARVLIREAGNDAPR